MQTIGPVTDPSDSIVLLLSQAEQDKKGQVAAADRLEILLRDANLLYESRIPPRMVGFDPCNRDGEGGNPLNVLALASEIAACGWSSSEVNKAICAEVVPQDDTVEKFNRKLSTDSGMATVEENSIHYGSLACGHTNYVLRCIGAGVPSTCGYLSENGHMSVTKLAVRDPAMAEVVASGLHWKVIKWQVRFLYPTAINFIQSARNIASTMFRQESEIQGLLRLHQMSSTAQRAGLDIPWAVIKKSILRSRPPYSGSLEEMVLFIVARSGGIKGNFLLYLAAFYRNHVDSTRHSVPAALYASLADFPLHYLALAIYQAAWKCPAEAVHAGVCKGVTAAEVNALAKTTDAKLRAKRQAAEDALTTARADLKTAGILDDWDSTKLCKIFARLDISMARFVLDKQGPAKQTLQSVADIGRQFVKDLRMYYPLRNLDVFVARYPEAVVGEASGSVAIDASKLKADAAAGKLTLVALDVLGTVTDPLALLREKGFDIGSHTAEARAGVSEPEKIAGASEPQTMYQICSVEEQAGGPHVVLRNVSSETCLREVALQIFLKGWEHRDFKNFVEIHPGWPGKRPMNLPAVQSLVRRGGIVQCLAHLSTFANYQAEDRVTIYTKPTRKVEASCPAEIGDVVLLPETNSVKTMTRTGGTEPPANTVEVHFEPQDPDNQYYLMPCCGLTCVAPLWCVGTTEEQADANMAWTTVKVTFLLGHDFYGPLKPKVGEAKAKEQPKAKAKEKGKAAPKKEKHKAIVEAAICDEGTQSMLAVPVLVNCKPLLKGDELRVYKLKVEQKKARDVQPINIATLAKRAKTKE
jgi:hypothetical protein